jgi:hypothetical protein
MKTTIFEGYGCVYVYIYGSNGCGHDDGGGNGDGYGYGHGLGRGWCDGSGNGKGLGNGLGYGNGRGFVILLSPIRAYHIISGYSHHAGKDIDTEHAYNAGEKIRLCRHGLHASLYGARYYATGTETRVLCSGRVMFNYDKLVCEHREVVEVL